MCRYLEGLQFSGYKKTPCSEHSQEQNVCLLPSQRLCYYLLASGGFGQLARVVELLEEKVELAEGLAYKQSCPRN